MNVINTRKAAVDAAVAAAEQTILALHGPVSEQWRWPSLDQFSHLSAEDMAELVRSNPEIDAATFYLAVRAPEVEHVPFNGLQRYVRLSIRVFVAVVARWADEEALVLSMTSRSPVEPSPAP